jgi:hypothetical protein
MEEKNIKIEFKKIEIEADIKDISLYHNKINNIITDKIINSNINYK